MICLACSSNVKVPSRKETSAKDGWLHVSMRLFHGAVQSGANLVKSASVSNLGGLCKHYSGQPFTAQLPTLAKAPDGLGPSPSPGPMDGNSCARLASPSIIPSSKAASKQW